MDGDQHRQDISRPSVRGELVQVELVDQETGQQDDRRRTQEQDVEDVPGQPVPPLRSLIRHSRRDIPASEAFDGERG
jgi:hypothetical protein